MITIPAIHEACKVEFMKPEKYREGLRCQLCINHNLIPHPEPEKDEHGKVKRSFPLKIWLRDGGQVKAVCSTCGEILDFVERIGLKAMDSTIVEPLPECPPEPRTASQSDVLPSGDVAPTPEVKPAEIVAPMLPPQVELVEPEIPAGREPGSDDEPTATPATNFKRKPLRELAKQHPGTTPMLVRDYFPTKSIITVFGEPGSGKTTLVTDVVASIDMGFDWRGKRVNQGIVWYIAAEDPHGVRLRFEAWYENNNLNFEDDTNIEIIEEPICFAINETVDKFIADYRTATKKPILIVLDTLSDTSDKFDLNTDMGLFMRGFERFRNETGCSIIIIHHCGHAAKDRPRNGSELMGKSDVIMPVKCEENITTLSCSKMKNGSKLNAKPLSWSMKVVKTKWIDAYEEVITSVVIDPTDKQASHLTNADKIALEALKDALIKYGVENAGVVSVTEDDWRQTAYDLGISNASPEAKKKAFARSHVRLMALNRVKHHAGRYWLPKKGDTGHYRDIVPLSPSGKE